RRDDARCIPLDLDSHPRGRQAGGGIQLTLNPRLRHSGNAATERARSSSSFLALSGLGGFGFELGEKRVAAFTSHFDILGAERTTDAFLGERRGVNGVVQKPSPVVVPQVVVRVVRANTDAG